jgi:hypothetical protein
MLEMRGVLELPAIAPNELPARQRRTGHWSLTPAHLTELATSVVRRLPGLLVVDEHEQVKILSGRTWRGAWRDVTLWRDGIEGLSAHELMGYLAALTSAAQERAPHAARALLTRSRAVAATERLAPHQPRSR